MGLLNENITVLEKQEDHQIALYFCKYKRDFKKLYITIKLQTYTYIYVYILFKNMLILSKTGGL